jgi:hypothetical protein
MKYTPWFPPEIKPVHVGVYQVFNDFTYAYWGGKRWGYVELSVKQAVASKNTKFASQYKTWRGLTTEDGK